MSASGHDHAGHDHAGHGHGPARYDRAFAVGISLNLAFVVVELIFGVRSHSLALTADAGHNFGDVLGLILAWGATMLARRKPTARHTYGLRRFSILAALGNACLLLIAVGAIALEAVRRINNTEPVASRTVMIVALVGIVINVGTALGFAAGRANDMNIRGAFLHMLGDAAVSAGVVVAALAIATTGWFWLDPVVSLIVVALITVGSWGLLRDSFNLAIDAVPPGVDLDAVEAYLRSLPGVTEVHDLHVWGLSTTSVALTAHLIIPSPVETDALIGTTCAELLKRFRIEHATLQIEHGSPAHPCGLAPAGVV